MPDAILEVCVDDAAGLEAAIAGGADRIELCAALSLGGLTPSAGFMALAGRAAIPIYAMIRPRAGDFIYTPNEIEQMCIDIATAKAAGLRGVVLGAMHADGRLHQDQLVTLVGAAAGLGLTLHRVVDVLTEPAEIWLDAAIGLKFERILTSGGEASALAGLPRLKRLVAQARGRIVIMPGAGVTAQNVGTFRDELASTQVHASCSRVCPAATGKAGTLGFAPDNARQTDEGLVRALKMALRPGA
jgi:copper homeostasis protein